MDSDLIKVRNGRVNYLIFHFMSFLHVLERDAKALVPWRWQIILMPRSCFMFQMAWRMDLSWTCPYWLLSGVVNTLLQCQTTHLLSLLPHVLRHWVLPAHLTLPVVHLGSFDLTFNDWLTDLFTVFTRHTSLVLLNNPAMLQQSQLCKTRCGSPLLKTKLLFIFSGI